MCQEASWGVYGTMGDSARSVCTVVRAVPADVRTVSADVRTDVRLSKRYEQFSINISAKNII